MWNRTTSLALLVVLVGACTTETPDYCTTDEDCTRKLSSHYICDLAEMTCVPRPAVDGRVDTRPVPDSAVDTTPSTDAGSDRGLVDGPVAVCGNGKVDPGERCDTLIATGQAGACPAVCDDANDCTTDALKEAGTCQAVCEQVVVTACQHGDGCCPTGCNATTDDDCSPDCGNGKLDALEKCDTTIPAGTAGACPTSCDDGNACTKDQLLNGGTCAAECLSSPITQCVGGDGCCPAGCFKHNDSDCSQTCGSGTVDTGETCDTAIAAGQPGACPSACDDANACTQDTLQNGGTCTAACQFSPISNCKDNDGCCPTGCFNSNDNDCSETCDDGIVQAAKETCDTKIAAGQPGACPTTCSDGQVCTLDALQNGGTCAAACTFTTISQCKHADGCCPAGCFKNQDSDCADNCGNGQVDAGEKCDTAIPSGAGACPTACPDDGDACTTEQLVGTKCAAECTKTTITQCASGDGCCPTGCNNLNDLDCGVCTKHADCQSGVCNVFETFDPATKGQCIAEAGICYVNATSSATSGCGTKGTPCKTISACLATKKKWVSVADGTYPEDLTVAADVALVAPSTVGPLRHPTGPDPVYNVAKVKVQLQLNGITNAASALAIYGFDITVGPSTCTNCTMVSIRTTGEIRTTHVHGDVISNERQQLYCVRIFAAAKERTVLRDVAIHDCVTGVYSGATADLEVYDANIWWNTSHGLYQEDTSGNTGAKQRLKVRDTLFAANSGSAAGTCAALRAHETDLDLDRVEISRNGVPFLTNCRGLLVESNSTGKIVNLLSAVNSQEGLVFSNNPTPPGVVNATIYQNNWTGTEYDVDCGSTADVQFFNTIVWDPDATALAGVYQGRCKFSYSDVMFLVASPPPSPLPAPYNIGENPQIRFLDLFNGNTDDFRLKSTSPAIDAGTLATPVTLPSTDLENLPRLYPATGKVDIGAYEYRP